MPPAPSFWNKFELGAFVDEASLVSFVVCGVSSVAVVVIASLSS